MHLNDGQIQRLIHGEMEATAREEASRHTATCAECAQALANAEREEAAIFDLLGQLDHEAPLVDAAKFVLPTRRHSATWARRAAGIVVVAAMAGAAYAIPGSPLPALMKRVASLMTGEHTTPPATVDESTPGAPVTSGIAVPAGGHFVIQFAGAQEAGSVTVSLSDDAMVRVRAIGGTAAFTTDVGRLDIDNTGSSADYEIEIPRSAPSIEIRVGSSSLLQKDGDHVVTNEPADAQGRYRIVLTGP